MLEKTDLTRILETAIVAAHLAGQRAMEGLEYIRVSVKNEEELVTQADSECQQLIIERIKQTYPDHGFIAEEGPQGKIFKQPPRGTEPIWWVIDPIDGTNNYAHRMFFFTVSIAAMFEGFPIVGVVFEPATDSMFTAVKDGYAQLNGRRIQVSDDEIGPFTSIGLDSHFDQGVPDWACDVMQKCRFRNLGSTALQLAYVAKAGLVGTIITRPKLWDIAAGAILAESAGAIVTDWKGEKIFPVDLNSYNGGTFQTLAANKKTHPQLLKIINL